MQDWSPPYDFSAAKTTFVDAWPTAWRALAPDYEIVPIDRLEINALGAQIMGFRHWFTPCSTQPLIQLAHRLDRIIAKQNRACFVRLTSRSPKDSLYAMRNGLRVCDGAQALAVLLEGSERCAADLRMALDNGQPMAIVVRKWLDFSPWIELRCFMLSRVWAGASQTQHNAKISLCALEKQMPDMLMAFSRAMAEIIQASPIENAAFDLVYRHPPPAFPSPAPAILLDANPLWDVTDMALFSSISDLDGTLRFRHAESPAIRALPLPPGLSN